MKANEVLKMLKITRPTLAKYVKEGKLKATRLPSGQYDYSKESALKLMLERYESPELNNTIMKIHVFKRHGGATFNAINKAISLCLSGHGNCAIVTPCEAQREDIIKRATEILKPFHVRYDGPNYTFEFLHHEGSFKVCILDEPYISNTVWGTIHLIFDGFGLTGPTSDTFTDRQGKGMLSGFHICDDLVNLLEKKPVGFRYLDYYITIPCDTVFFEEEEILEKLNADKILGRFMKYAEVVFDE